MAKNKKIQETEPQQQVPNKSIDEMSDVEFITYADYLSSPYYRAYMNAKAKALGVGTDYLMKDSQGELPVDGNYEDKAVKAGTVADKNTAKKTKEAKAVKGGKIYTKKRAFALVLILLFMFVCVAAVALGSFEVQPVTQYTALYVKDGALGKAVGELDPALGLIKKLAKVDVDSVFYNTYLSNIPADVDLVTNICLYAVPAASILFVIFAIIGVIKALGALCAKKTVDGFYKKYKFGFISIVMFLCSLIMLVGGLYVNNTAITDILSFLTGKTSGLYAGYGLYGFILIPVITFICSCCGYKKLKKLK